MTAPTEAGAGVAKRTIRLTKTVLAELNYKLDILADDVDLHESYGLDAEQAETMRDRFAAAKPGTFEVTEAEAEVISGELENAADIEHDNADRSSAAGSYNRAAALRKAASGAQP